MLSKLVFLEFTKLKRQSVWMLVLLGSLGILAVPLANFLIRYDYIYDNYDGDLYAAMFTYIMSLMPAVLMLAISIITSVIANTEHAENTLKQLLSLPISKWRLYLAKLMVTMTLLFISSVLVFVGMFVMSQLLNFEGNFPLLYALTLAFAPLLAALPITILQLWLALNFKNQGIVLSVGVFFAVLVMFSDRLPNWLPLTWPTMQVPNPLVNISLGLILGLICYVVTNIHFNKKDV